MKPGYVYIITNEYNTTLYIGVTSDLHQRIKEHKEKRHINSFSARFNLNKLVYFETFQMIEDAITREKQLKAGSKAKKVGLIVSINPEWKDLYFEIENHL
ncbi:GIY-YIG nuclease family protein [Flavobacterium zepuense]|uniref:GIY-YIG nuclease family protein n=1 Tax=Flavobacterium zepuense TaxID=2593302 RepID=A0A552UVB2_9FLAO|nr:GIY-YIG nuclease family protein [Flavobacterium zepuense]TRW22162.1 GIY-YIG nuclease family protein [Flavobacterium zepuense]